MTARKNVWISRAQISIYGWKITIVEMVLANRISAQVQILKDQFQIKKGQFQIKKGKVQIKKKSSSN